MLVLSIAFVLQAGLRKDEILTLQKRDIDLERKLILLDDSKTGNTAIPLCEELETFIRSMFPLDQMEPEELLFGGVDWIEDTFPEVCKEAKIKGLHFHDLRATYGTRLLENGYDLITVMLAMRHKRVTSTQVYMRLQSHHVRAAIESLSSGKHKNLSQIRHKPATAGLHQFSKLV